MVLLGPGGVSAGGPSGDHDLGAAQFSVAGYTGNVMVVQGSEVWDHRFMY